jgi:hypothetical protein
MLKIWDEIEALNQDMREKTNELVSVEGKSYEWLLEMTKDCTTLATKAQTLRDFYMMLNDFFSIVQIENDENKTETTEIHA